MSEEPEDLKDENNNAGNFAKYSQIGFQMFVTISASAYIGHFIDGKIQCKIPIFTIVFSLSAIGISLYNLIRQLPKE